MDVDARAAGKASPEKEWWLRALMVCQAPSSVFRAMRDDSDEQAEARQEPVIALVFLAGIASILTWSPTTGTLLDDPRVDGLLAVVLVFLAGAMYGGAAYWLGGALLHLGLRGAGGKGSYRRTRHLLAFATAPLALSLIVVWPVRLALYGGDAFRAGGSDAAGPARLIFDIVSVAFVLWSLGLLAVGISAVQRWTILRAAVSLALMTLALGAVTVLIPLSTW